MGYEPKMVDSYVVKISKPLCPGLKVLLLFANIKRVLVVRTELE